ncbi:MAG: dephospho-CoA kinase [Terrimicrobiaceae bacterium]
MDGKRLAVTGGIATGKSTFSRMLADRLDALHFCADEEVGKLLKGDPAVKSEMIGAFGEKAFSGNQPNRPWLRELVFGDEARRLELEAILHPRVRKRWESLGGECQNSGRFFVADIPLLFEAGGWEHFDAVVCVSCSGEIRRERLLARPGIDEPMAKKMIASQLPLATKEERSHHLVWNDGALDALEAQAGALARLFLDVRPGHSHNSH